MCHGHTHQVQDAYLVYKRVCEDEKTPPMSHLAFHVDVATAWCTTPQLILKPATAAAAVPLTPADGMQRGRARSKPSASGSASAEPTEEKTKRLKRITPAALERCKAAFALAKVSHQPVPPIRSGAAVPKNCQVCSAGFGPFKPNDRFQKLSAMACSQCTYHVCSAECWQVLHGNYTGEYGLLPCVDGEDNGEQDDESEGEDAGDGSEGEL